MDVTDYNMHPDVSVRGSNNNNSASPLPLPSALCPSSPLPPPAPQKDDVNASLQLENDVLRQRVNRLAQIEDYSIHLKTRVDDLERQLEDRITTETSATRRDFSQSEIMFGDVGDVDDVQDDDDVEAGPRRPLLSSTFRISSPSSTKGDSTASKTLVRQKTTALKNLARFFCGVDQPNLKRAVAAARRMPLLFWTYMILIHFFFFRCFLSEFVSLGFKDGHNGL